MEDIVRTNNFEVAYICDRRACEYCSFPTCKHTTDLNHAANFVRLDGNKWIEKED